jgi:hypothetical protein
MESKMTKAILFDMHLRVPHDRMSTIIDALSGACEVIKIEQFVQTETAQSNGNHHYANGIRNKGVRGDNLLLELLKDGPRTKAQLAVSFAQRGFAKTSISPVVSKAVQTNKVAFVDGLVSLK